MISDLIVVAGLSNPVDTLFHLQPVMILVLLPIAIPVDGKHTTYAHTLTPHTPSHMHPPTHSSHTPSHMHSHTHSSHILTHSSHTPSYICTHTGTNVGTSVLVFRASDWAEFGWSTAYILPAACMAFMLGVSEYLLVYHTSGLTLSVAGVLKVCGHAVVFSSPFFPIFSYFFPTLLLSHFSPILQARSYQSFLYTCTCTCTVIP